MNYTSRMQIFQQALAADGVDLAFIPISADLHYLTGIPRDTPNFGNTIHPGNWIEGLFVTPAGRSIFTVTRMTATFHLDTSRTEEVRILADAADPLALVRDVVGALGVSGKVKIAVGERAWAQTLINVTQALPEASYVSATDMLRQQRVIKDADEIATMRRAGAITEAAYADVRATIKAGITELDLISEVDYQIKKHGGMGPSFTTSMYNQGPNLSTTLTNREASLRVPLQPPMALLFDFGAIYEGYCYDYGRTVFFGEPDAEYEKIYKLIMDSQAAGIAALKADSATCEQVDAAARSVIEQAGYGQYFMHRLGHGIGMDVHEPPFLTAGSTTTVRAGMFFTVEPSILIFGKTGARVEDIIMAAPGGGVPLTSSYGDMFVVSA